MDAVWLYLLEHEGVETADRIVTDLFKSFYRLADNPAIGHRRPDLTTRDALVYKVFSYLVIHLSGTSPLQIVGVIHGKLGS
jgi:plasmid stabilization system protein ParE